MIVIGRINAISTSKIKKITAIKKNRNENGIRADLLGSNPHSNGDAFSRSSLIFFEIVLAIIIIIVVILNVSVVSVVMISIIYLVCSNFLIGSQIYLLY